MSKGSNKQQVAEFVLPDLSTVAHDFASMSAATSVFTEASKSLGAASKLPTVSALDAATALRAATVGTSQGLTVADGRGKKADKVKTLNRIVADKLIESGVNEGTASQAGRFIVWVAADPTRARLARKDGEGEALAWKKAFAAVHAQATGAKPDNRAILRARVTAALALLDDESVDAIVASKWSADDISDALIRESEDKANGTGYYYSEPEAADETEDETEDEEVTA
jgi:hypothetical protein